MLTLDERTMFRELQTENDNLVIAAMEAMLAQGILADGGSGIPTMQRELTPLVVNATWMSASLGATSHAASRRNALGPRGAAGFIANPLVRTGLEIAVMSTIAWGANRILSSETVQSGVSDLAGGLTRHVRSGARTTLEAAVRDDPDGPRYRRVPRSGGCEWCLMLASRGYVYSSEKVALVASGERGDQPSGDQYHDHCTCTAEAQYKNERPPEFVQFLEAEWRRLNWVGGRPAYSADVAWANWYQHVHGGGLGDRPKPKPVGRPAITTDDPQ